MTEQDRAGQPAKDEQFRAIDRSKSVPDTIMLQYPELIIHFPNHKLEKRNNDGTWSPYELPVESPTEDPHQEDVEKQT